MNFDKDFNPIYKAYRAKLQSDMEKSLEDLSSPVEYLVTYLGLLRDYRISQKPILKMDDEVEPEITSLIAAIAAYERYKNCKNKYYKLENDKAVQISDDPEDLVTKKYLAEKQFYWVTFWKLISQHLTQWEVLNA